MKITGTIIVEYQFIAGHHVYAVYETPRKLWAFCPTWEQANLIKDLLDGHKFNDTWTRQYF